MKTNSKKIISVFLSLLMTFMCMTSVAVQSAGSKMILHFSELTASAGQDAQLDLIVENPIAIKELSNMILTAPDGFEFTGMSETSPAFNGSVTYQTDGKNLNFSITSNGTVGSENLAVSIYMHVSENCATGNYTFNWKTMAMSCITADGYNYTPTVNYGIVTVGDSVVPPETTTTETITQTTATETSATTTTTTVSAYIEITIKSYPTKTAYTIGEELDLSGGVFQANGIISNGTHFTNMPERMESSKNVDISEFDNTKAGTYRIYIRKNFNTPTGETLSDETYFEVTVSDPEDTTTTQTTATETTTTTTTTKKYTYSVRFVDEETNQAVSGVKYNIVSYYALDPAQIVQTSGENPQSFEFISDTAYVALLTVTQAIPDGYYIPDNATRWELSANNPDLTVYLRKSETTTTTSTTSTMKTTTTTTTNNFVVSTKLNVTINSYPTKTAYTIGEELDLSGGTFSYSHTVLFSNGQEGTDSSKPINMKNSKYIDTSEFDSSKEGTYKIYIKVPYNDAFAESYFEVTVSDNGESFRLGDVDNDGMINAVDATLILTEYALLSTGDTGTFNDTQKKSADVDGDGMINAVDATFVLSYYAYLSTGGSDKIEKWLADSSQN